MYVVSFLNMYKSSYVVFTVYMYVRMYMYVCVCTYVCMYVCMYVSRLTVVSRAAKESRIYTRNHKTRLP